MNFVINLKVLVDIMDKFLASMSELHFSLIHI